MGDERGKENVGAGEETCGRWFLQQRKGRGRGRLLEVGGGTDRWAPPVSRWGERRGVGGAGGLGGASGPAEGSAAAAAGHWAGEESGPRVRIGRGRVFVFLFSIFQTKFQSPFKFEF